MFQIMIDGFIQDSFIRFDSIDSPLHVKFETAHLSMLNLFSSKCQFKRQERLDQDTVDWIHFWNFNALIMRLAREYAVPTE